MACEVLMGFVRAGGRQEQPWSQQADNQRPTMTLVHTMLVVGRWPWLSGGHMIMWGVICHGRCILIVICWLQWHEGMQWNRSVIGRDSGNHISGASGC